MNRYCISFSKSGYGKYSSHLDLLRLFKRAFRRAGIPVAYSHGFNPHPKMSFAQPLSLGYAADNELLEFETEEPVSLISSVSELNKDMPQGITVACVGEVSGAKSLAASVYAADFTVSVPVPYYEKDYPALVKDYLAKDEILAEKKQKKTGKTAETNIRGKIRDMSAEKADDNTLILKLKLDCGSKSNLSPELVIGTFFEFADKQIKRHVIDVSRTRLYIPIDISIKWL